MSYIKCKSFITNKEVQYGLIDVKLKHNILQQDYGALNTSSTTYWNTAPGLLATRKMKLDNNNNLYSNVNAMKMAAISGRKEQAYSASGMLDSEYIYVRSGKQPIISNRVFDVEKMNEGYNQFDLFETDNIKVILECLKIKASKLYIAPSANFSFIEIDGSSTEDPYVIADCVIKQILKSSNIVIGEYSYIYNISDEIFPIKFALNTEVFRIVDFDPSYYTETYYSNRYSLWLDNSCTQNNKLYNNGEFVSGKGDLIGIAVSVFMSDYWYTKRNSYDMKRRQITNTDGTIISDTLLRNFNNLAQNSLYNHNINNNPNRFIIFGEPKVGASEFTTTKETLDIANSVINSENNYLTKGYNYSDTNVAFPWNFILSPIMTPIVTTDYKEVSPGTSGVFIPLTNTVYEGNPETPDDPGEETTEPADDPDTKYTPVLPGDVSPGYEVWHYPSTEFINGIPGDVDSWDPLYSSFIFKSYYKSNTGVFQPDSAWEFINDCNNASISEPFHALFKLATGHPSMQELIARIYELPFDYDEIFTDPVMLTKSTINYGYVGIITVGFSNNGEADTTAVHYYNRATRKFYQLNLGSLTLQKVFNNYLDYTDTVYKLNLPYGAGTVELDPNLLFDNKRVEAIINIKGYLDIDTGFLVIKVLLNNQIYYETSVNVAVDMIANSTNSMAVPVTLTKMIGGLSAGSLGTAMMMESRYNYSKMLAESKNILSKEKQEKITEETEKRLKLAEESWNRMHSARKGDGK